MKSVKAIIQAHMLGRVLSALHELPHFPGLTIFDVKGQGRGRGQNRAYSATEGDIFFSDHKQIEVICADIQASVIAETIYQSAHTGRSGDGIIWIADVAEIVRIRSGERGEPAV